MKKDIQGMDIEEGVVYDKNSMYPDKMAHFPLPYGQPVTFTGKYEYDKDYPLYIQTITCSFKLKPGFLPTYQDKSGFFKFDATEYLESSEDENGEQEITMTLTNLDLELFLEHYDVFNLVYHNGVKFQQSTSLFTEFVNYWYGVKEQAAKDGNGGLKQIAKIMLNSCYGKFGTNPHRVSREPYLGDDKIIHYRDAKIEDIDAEYIPVATFITAWARYDIINQAQALYDRFLYADTDSLHLAGLEEPPGLDIDKYRLGAWDKELTFSRARYLRAKSYIEEDINSHELLVKCGGMPEEAKAFVTWENFHIGAEFKGKLQHKTVVGGVILKEVPYKINP